MAWDPVWEEIFRAREWGKYPAEDVIRFVARRFVSVADRSKFSLLEIGCGPGGNLWYMAREGFSVYGVDGSATAVRRAVQRLDFEVPGWQGEVAVGDISSLPQENSRFDAVIDSAAVYCNSFQDSVRIYAEALRVLKPGGSLFVRTFASGSLGDGTGEELDRDRWLVSEGPGAGMGAMRFTRREDVPTLLSGFEIEALDLMTLTVDGDELRAVKQWLITARKPQ